MPFTLIVRSSVDLQCWVQPTSLSIMMSLICMAMLVDEAEKEDELTKTERGRKCYYNFHSIILAL